MKNKTLIQRLYDSLCESARLGAYTAIAGTSLIIGCNSYNPSEPNTQETKLPTQSNPQSTPQLTEAYSEINSETRQGKIDMFANEPSNSPTPSGLVPSKDNYTSKQQKMALEGINPDVFPTRKAYEDWKNQSETESGDLVWDSRKKAYSDGKEYFYPTKNRNVFKSKSGKKIAID